MASRHCQIPRALLYSPEHSGLAVAAWCLYETLETPDLLGGRKPARARRSWSAEHLGTTERTLDRARTQLLTKTASGPWLARKVRGRKRSALHHVLGRPRETGAPYAAVPAWTLDLIHAGTGRPEGSVSPDTWRTYAVLVDRLDLQGHDLTTVRLGEWLSGSAATARRRLHELEAVGWVAVRRTSGQWMHVRVIYYEDLVGVIEQEESEEATPCESGEAPLADLSTYPLADLTTHPLANLSTPYETPSEDSSSESTPSEDDLSPLAVGDHLAVSANTSTADAERKISKRQVRAAPRQARPRPKGAPSVMALLPLDWQARMTHDELERVMSAIEDEMSTGRTITDMKARVHRRLPHWRGREVHRPVAAALTVVRRGYDCPHLACEDHVLPSGYPCEACAAIGSQVNQARLASTPDVPEGLRPVMQAVPIDHAHRPLERLEPVGDEVRGMATLRAELAAARERPLGRPRWSAAG
ncbi:hypothetical protein [Streptosporangium canum]|uniref:hypothetical protein n=1 Tax=Streptosporangium canum TaxID=324952 RepID=UPI00378A6D11